MTARKRKAASKTTTGCVFGNSILVERIGPNRTKKLSYLFGYDPSKHDLSIRSVAEFRKETPRARTWRQSRILWKKGDDPAKRGRIPVDAEILCAAESAFTDNLTVEGFCS